MSQELIDLQFDRAVEIVQGLPNNGPIQTGYEEKLAMYSLYKQATVGNVTTPRPSIFDMLGRAKYDAWAKQKDLDPKEAKWRYVETLMKVLRKYSEGTVAKDLVEELESYGDPSNVVMSSSLHRSDSESNSGDSVGQHDTENEIINETDVLHEQETTDDDGDDNYDHSRPPVASMPDLRRPGSAISSQQRYRTPMAGSTIAVPIPSHVLSPSGTPALQPLPEHPAPSAYGPSGSPQPLQYPASLAQQFSGGSQRSASPRHMVPVNSYSQYRGTPSFQRNQQFSRPPLERAVESMQASLAALHERLETLETVLGYGAGGGAGVSRASLHSQRSRIPSPNRNGANEVSWPRWDISNMGAWSVVLRPLSRLENNVRAFAQFLAHSDDNSPILIIIRRLFLDLSFLIVCLVIAKSIWRRTRIRRAEVTMALREVWRALTGQRVPRVMAERGV